MCLDVSELEELRKPLSDRLSEEDVKNLCQYTYLNYEDMEGDRYSDRLLAVLGHLYQDGRLTEFNDWLHLPDETSRRDRPRDRLNVLEAVPWSRIEDAAAKINLEHLKAVKEVKLEYTYRCQLLQHVGDSTTLQLKLGARRIELTKRMVPELVEPLSKGGLAPIGWNLPDTSVSDTLGKFSAKKITEIYRAIDRRLLILGSPGAGKTFILNELARELAGQAWRDDRKPIPITLRLSEWTSEEASLESWVIDQTKEHYGIQELYLKEWMSKGLLLPLLDGLNEVKPECQRACAEAINTFVRNHPSPGIVVSCRKEDYEALDVRLKLNGAIVLEPLKPQEFDSYLEVQGPELDGLRRAVGVDAALRKLAESPLMLYMMSEAYRDVSFEDLATHRPVNLEERRKHLFDRYIDKMFEHCEDERRRAGETIDEAHYSREAIVHYLSWLGQQMLRHSQRIFVVERIQGDWLLTIRQRLAYLVAAFFLFSSVAACVLVVPYFLLFHGEHLSIALSSLLIFGLVATLWKFESVQLAERVYLTRGFKGGSWLQRTTFVLQLVARILVTPVLLLGVVLVVLVGLGIGAAAGGGLFIGLGWRGVKLGGRAVKSVLWRSLAIEDIDARPEPGEEVWDSAKNAVTMGLVMVPFFLVTSILLHELRWGIFLGLAAALVTGLLFGGAGCIRHVILRAIFHISGDFPWNYVPFLNYADRLTFLPHKARSHEFFHDMLLEYFASPSFLSSHKDGERLAPIYFRQGSQLAPDPASRSEAELWLKRAIDCDHQFIPAYECLASLLAQDPSRHADAEGIYRQLIALQPKSWGWYDELGALLADNPARRAEALSAFTQALTLNPTLNRAYNHLEAFVDKNPDSLGDATSVLKAVIARRPKSARARIELGRLLTRDSRSHAEAEASYRKAIQLRHPRLAISTDKQELPFAYFYLGELLAKGPTRHTEALDAYRKVLRLRPDLNIVYYRLAALAEQDETQRPVVETVLSKMIPRMPGSSDLYYCLARVLALDPKRRGDAERAYRQAIRLNPKFAYAYRNLGVLLSSDPQRRSNAEMCLRQALALDPNNADFRHTLDEIASDSSQAGRSATSG